MSQNLRSFVVMAGMVLLGWFAATYSTSSGQNQAPARAIHWQYRIDHVNAVDDARINKLGNEGWELVIVILEPNGPYLAIYKRPLQ